MMMFRLIDRSIKRQSNVFASVTVHLISFPIIDVDWKIIKSTMFELLLSCRMDRKIVGRDAK